MGKLPSSGITKTEPTWIVEPREAILVTGSPGFIGRYVVGELIEKGFSDIRCLVRETSDIKGLTDIIKEKGGDGKATIVQGNLLSPDDCLKVTKNVKLIYHLAAGTGTKSFSEAYLNSVITTRNLIEAALHHRCLKRFVNVSSFAVYTNRGKKTGRVLDETCPVETSPETRAEAYCYGKVKQDELVMDYGKRSGLPYVIVRPGTVYGPGKKFIPGRVGIDTFGIFLHFGGSNPLPLSYVENCAEAIVLAGLIPGIDGEIFNIVDDDLPTSREFLKLYKKMFRVSGQYIFQNRLAFFSAFSGKSFHSGQKDRYLQSIHPENGQPTGKKLSILTKNSRIKLVGHHE